MANLPPDALLRARRALEDLDFYELINDWVWNDSVKKWVLRCRLTVPSEGMIPAISDWFIVMDIDYPWGDIELYPAKNGGLTYTFPHQSLNALGKPELPWRDGKICSQTPMRSCGRRAYDIEPFTIDDRLRWRIIRAKGWLEAASKGRVVENGEPFELPDFPRQSVGELGFVENEESFHFWQNQTVIHGLSTILQRDGNGLWSVIESFSKDRDRIIRTIEYGTTLTNASLKKSTAMWILLPGVPALKPWQAPATFGELRSVLSDQGITFDKIIQGLAPLFRDGKRYLLIIGFPIPISVGGESHIYHWQALRLPVLSHGKLNGFRPTEANFARNDIKKILSDNVHIDWVNSRNWAEDQIRTRGRGSPQLIGSKVLLLGGGALGSSIAEILVREGCKIITIVDGDILDIGNLCRHTLSLQHINTLKAASLAARLNGISPHATIKCIPRNSYDCTKAEQQQMAECDIILDCTGEDRALHHIAKLPWPGNKLFVSASLGIQARRLFLFAAQGERFPHSEYITSINPWLQRELKEYEGLQLPREGIGCWHPVFPARSNDVYLMSTISVKCIDVWASHPPHSPLLKVYEQDLKDGCFAGVRLVEDL